MEILTLLLLLPFEKIIQRPDDYRYGFISGKNLGQIEYIIIAVRRNVVRAFVF